MKVNERGDASSSLDLDNHHGDEKKEEKNPIVLDYIITLNEPKANKSKLFASNYVRTTKYTFISFLPLNLLLQLTRVSNIYFILTMIFSLIPGASPIFPITSILPVVFILGTTALKDGFEDFMRYLVDVKHNNKILYVIRDGKEVKIRSKNIRVGDIVKLKLGEEFPSDLLLLASSNDNGTCFIETANLDGEPNLKLKFAIPETKDLRTLSDISKLTGKVNAEKPRFEFHILNASIQIGEKSRPLSEMNLLLRGANLRNTQWIYGLALYTGKNSNW